MNQNKSTIGPQSAHHRNINGLLIINKDKDWTSHDVVAKVRGMFKLKKVGHTGTLDPQATGVLVLCLGKATKLVEFLIKDDKEYEAEITLGITSTTDDEEGEKVETKVDTPPGKEDLEAALMKFVGTYDQMPPDFSAKKVGGKKAYEAARKGKPLKLEPKEITVHSIQILDYEWPTLRLRVHCGSGFYVRSLARDVGKALEVGGYLSGLVRTRSGKFILKDAKTIEEVTEKDIIQISSIIGSLPTEAIRKVKIMSL